MSKPPFRFKQFQVHHDKCAMKVGTDAVLLGALAGNKDEYSDILEIGLGSGVVSLMLAQRFENAKIEGVEIDQDAFDQASQNAMDSPWAQRLNFKLSDFRMYYKSENRKFDLIVSNPPYFSDHLKSSNAKKNTALHTDSLPFHDLLEGVDKLLSSEGEFWLILPKYEADIFRGIAIKKDFFNHKLIEIKDNKDKNVLRNILSFSKYKKEILCNQVLIKDLRGDYTNEYKNILRDFLIIF